MNTNGSLVLCSVLLILLSGSSICTVLSGECKRDYNLTMIYSDLITSGGMCNIRELRSSCEVAEPSPPSNISIEWPISPPDCWHFMGAMNNVDDISTRYSSKCLFCDILSIYLSTNKCYKYHVIPYDDGNLAVRDDRGYLSTTFWQYVTVSIVLVLLWMSMTLAYKIAKHMSNEYNKLLQRPAIKNKVRKRITIKEEYVTELNSLNNTKFKLKHLYCATCKEFCNCECTLNPLMRDLLQDTRFLCIAEQCDFIGSLAEFQEHFELCDLGAAICPFDKRAFQDADDLIQHLSTHTHVKKCVLDSLSLSIPLNLKEKMDFVIIAEYKKNYFVVFVNYNTGNTVSFKVGKHLRGNPQTIPTYTLFHDYEIKGLIQQRGDIVPLVSLLKHEEKYARLNVKLDLLERHSDVKIDFFDCANNKMNLIECPICFENIVYEFTQCVNGHPFCVSCAARCTTCAICRHKMVDAIKVNLKNVWAHHDFPCENLENGCLALLKLDERENHKNICDFRQVKCPYCYIKFRAVTIRTHFEKKHYGTNYFQPVTINFNSHNFLSSRFLIYRQKVFHVKTYFAERHLRCLVELINVDGISAGKYRYEVVIKNLSNVIVGRTSNVCVSRFDNDLKQFNAAPDFTSSINLEPLKNELLRGCHWRGSCVCTITFNIN